MKTQVNSDCQTQRGQAAAAWAAHRAGPACISPSIGSTGLRWMLCAAAVATTFCPASALADAGTPLVWGTAFHLLLGNLFLGLAEGWLLARVFRLPAGRCARWLTAANYLSAWLGWAWMGFMFERHATDIYSGLRVTWLLVGGAYLLTLLVEWPFVAACFRGTQRWLAASIKGSLLVQSASYLFLIGWYWLLSGTSLYTGLDVVRPDKIARPSGIVMFFISPEDGNVYRTDLCGSSQVKLTQWASTNPWPGYLELRGCASDLNYWDLVAVAGRADALVVWPRISSQQQVPPDQAQRSQKYGHVNFDVFQVGSATNSQWTLGWVQWPDVGLWAQAKGQTMRVAYGLPFGGWSVRRVVHLPDDKALVQLDHQICLLDIPGRKIALLKKGYGVLALHQDQLLQPTGPTEDSEPPGQPAQRQEP